METRTNSLCYNTPKFQILSDTQCLELQLSAEEELFRTGVEMHDENARELLRKHGCFIDGLRVRIPPSLTELALRSCQKHIVLCDSRTGQPRMFLEGSDSYFGSGSGAPYFRDPYTNERKHSTTEMIGWSAKVTDALVNLDFCMSLGHAQDVPLLVSDRWEFEQQLLNTSKPIVNICFDQWGQADCIAMAEAAAGGSEELKRHPFITLYTEPISPGVITEENCKKIMMGAEKSLPTIFAPCLMAGATAPATMAGTLVQGLAESLAGLVLSQSASEGAAFIIGGIYTIIDLGTTIMSYGAPELDLMLACLSDIGHFLSIPIFGTCGCSDSIIVDEQAGIEAALSITMTSLSGANMNHDIGYLESGNTANLDLAVLDDEIIGMARRLTSGIATDEQSLGLEELESTEAGGSFSPYQSPWDPEEDYIPKDQHQTFPSDLLGAAAEDLKGSQGQTVLGRCNEKLRSIIEYHEPDPLPKEAAHHIHSIVKNAVSNLPGASEENFF